jgi:hypothetical protein
LSLRQGVLYSLPPQLSTPSLEEQQEGGLAGEGGEAVWKEEDLFWFIQISDLHISRYVYPDLQEDLKEFLTTTIDSVRPGAVLVSGDLTDAKEQGGVGSRQQAAEWRAYRDLVRVRRTETLCRHILMQSCCRRLALRTRRSTWTSAATMTPLTCLTMPTR